VFARHQGEIATRICMKRLLLASDYSPDLSQRRTSTFYQTPQIKTSVSQDTGAISSVDSENVLPTVLELFVYGYIVWYVRGNIVPVNAVKTPIRKLIGCQEAYYFIWEEYVYIGSQDEATLGPSNPDVLGNHLK